MIAESNLINLHYATYGKKADVKDGDMFKLLETESFVGDKVQTPFMIHHGCTIMDLRLAACLAIPNHEYSKS